MDAIAIAVIVARIRHRPVIVIATARTTAIVAVVKLRNLWFPAAVAAVMYPRRLMAYLRRMSP